MLLTAFGFAALALTAADEPVVCEVLMSMAPPPAEAPRGEVCDDPDDPRCQLQRGDVPSSPSFPRVEQRVATVAIAAKTVLTIEANGVYAEARPIDSGVVESLFRPPR